MHSIAPEWTELAAGYQAIQSLKARLENEFGRAVQTGQKQKFIRELTEWQKKRRVFFILAVIAPLSILTLCLTAYYLREVACVIVYWVLLVGIILVTLAVAGRNYIREVMNPPRLEDSKKLPLDLEQRWWDSLSPHDPAFLEAGEKESFLAMLGKSLPNSCLAVRTPAPMLFTAAGIWLFQPVSWSGTIVREEGRWSRIQIIRDKRGRPLPQVQEQVEAPDEEWMKDKKELTNILNERVPHAAWTASLIQGGVVFTHPKASPDKTRIHGNLAGYGLVSGWVNRINRTPSVDGFSLEIQLQILDALHANKPEQDFSAGEPAEMGSSARELAEKGLPTRELAEKGLSANELADKLYQAAAEELRQSITGMMN